MVFPVIAGVPWIVSRQQMTIVRQDGRSTLFFHIETGELGCVSYWRETGLCRWYPYRHLWRLVRNPVNWWTWRRLHSAFAHEFVLLLFRQHAFLLSAKVMDLQLGLEFVLRNGVWRLSLLFMKFLSLKFLLDNLALLLCPGENT